MYGYRPAGEEQVEGGEDEEQGHAHRVEHAHRAVRDTELKYVLFSHVFALEKKLYSEDCRGDATFFYCFAKNVDETLTKICVLRKPKKKNLYSPKNVCTVHTIEGILRKNKTKSIQYCKYIFHRYRIVPSLIPKRIIQICSVNVKFNFNHFTLLPFPIC